MITCDVWNLRSTVSKNGKNSSTEEGEGSASHSKQREGQREITAFCSIICEFSIFLSCFLQFNAIYVWFSLICLESVGFLLYMKLESIEINCVNIVGKASSSSQAFISINSCTEFSKTVFPESIVKVI